MATATATATATKPSLLKTLSASNTTSLHIHNNIQSSSIFNPKSVSFSKPIKLPSLFLHKQTRFISFVAQTTSDWDQQDGSSVVLDEQQEPEETSTWAQLSDEGQGQEEAFPEPPQDAKLFVGNLPFDVDSENLAQLFQAAGIVEISEVIYNRVTDRSRGFGFVTMSTVEEAEKAIDMFNGYELNGRTLAVVKAAPRGARPERPPREFQPSFRIFVGNLPWDVDDARLEEVFSEHGKVLSARVVLDRETGRSRGFGFVTMASEAEMNDAVSALDGQTLDGRTIRVNVAVDRPRRSF